ncbi:hypothetical protein C0216_11040 [Streptomyces globosus]|uniref:Uncharacterized protein n=1 Tax=Streptomyces globosus TaxID=68209 RepID=A0A344TZ51_9ACTN|nr:hypothetical protein C0216_11040 [Streptomyces globosus]
MNAPKAPGLASRARAGWSGGERAEGARQTTPEGRQALRGVPARPVTPGRHPPPSQEGPHPRTLDSVAARARRAGRGRCPCGGGTHCVDEPVHGHQPAEHGEPARGAGVQTLHLAGQRPTADARDRAFDCGDALLGEGVVDM